jgi:hypothetical protein
MTTITEETTNGWRAELESIMSDVTDAESRNALAALMSALDPYFEHPEHFKTLLGKIASPLMRADQQDAITSQDFASLAEIEAHLPEGVTVTVL